MLRHPPTTRFAMGSRLASPPGWQSPLPPLAPTRGECLQQSPAPAASFAAPSRRRRWVATLLTPAIVLAMLVGGYFGWNWQAERRIRHLVIDLRSQGEPVTTAQIAIAPIADAENAAVLLRDAGESIAIDEEHWQSFYNLGQIALPLSELELSTIRAVLEPNGNVVQRVREAMSKPGIDWAPVIQSQRIRSPFGLVNPRGLGFFRQRPLCQLLCAAALVHHNEGDHHAALMRVEEMLFVADAAAQRRSHRGQIGSLELHELALGTLCELLPDLTIGTEPGNATPEQVRRLVSRLLDEQTYRLSRVNWLRADRARQIESVLPTSDAASQAAAAQQAPGFTAPLPVRPPVSWFDAHLGRPLYLRRVEQVLQRLTMGVNGFLSPDWRSFTTVFPEPIDSTGEPMNPAEDEHVRIVADALHQLGRSHFACLARRRAIAVGLAIRAYRVESGEWPSADLSELVPQILPSVPADPLAPSGERVIFKPHPARPRVYSVGVDGIDNGGWPAEPIISDRNQLRMTDAVVDLVRQPRPTSAPRDPTMSTPPPVGPARSFN